MQLIGMIMPIPDVAYRVSIDVQSFDSPTSGAVTLAVIWSVRPSKGNEVDGHTVASEVVSGRGYDALVNAHSRALASVANDIAVAMQSAAVQ